jgi:hypothetical protein
MDKKQFILSSIPRMAHYTFPYLTSVFGIVDQNRGKHLGSGVRCNLDGRRAVVTALHVIQQAEKEPVGSAISSGYGAPPFPITGQIHCDHADDLAVYYLPDEYPSRHDVSFWPQNRIELSNSRLATDYLFVHGFPAARSRFFELFKGIASKSLPYGAMQRLEKLPPDLNESQFALDYDPENMHANGDGASPDSFVDPHGLSGSPVWRIGASGKSAEHWTPDFSLLVGIITQWRPDEKILVASAISRIAQLAHHS